ncbi:hypothetical protein FQN57_006626 [Myotisia sp. PD_48]|nr:hypothetical protein FQN57_006626 [Myotisia sp. PD_48]
MECWSIDEKTPFEQWTYEAERPRSASPFKRAVGFLVSDLKVPEKAHSSFRPTSTMSSSLNRESSYTQVDPEHDLEAIGKHCQFEFCRQLDFLPFRCESCKGTFCLDHRTETTHKCPRAGAWAAARRAQSEATTNTSASLLSGKPTVYNSAQCSHPSCKKLIHTMTSAGVHCNKCRREYCLSHRLEEEHSCKTLTPLGVKPGADLSAGSASAAERARSAFSRLRSLGKDKYSAMSANLASKAKPKVRPGDAARERITQLNALKRVAKGDPKLDTTKRFYLHVEASADTTKAKFPTGDFYYDSAWSVGKVLDDAARKLQVQNVNNRVEGEDNKLRVFHVEGGKLLDFSEKIGASPLSQGDTIVLLRGVGPPVPDLITL